MTDKLKDLDQVEMGRRIRKQREFKKLTREDLSDLLGVSSKFISYVEYGEKGISIKTLYHLCQILEVTADYILAVETSDDEDKEKQQIRDDILEPLKKCNAEQLRCMEQIAKFYVEGIEKK